MVVRATNMHTNHEIQTPHSPSRQSQATQTHNQ